MCLGKRSFIKTILKNCYPINFYMMVEIVYACTTQSGSPYVHVAIQFLKCSYVTEQLN